MVHVDTGVYGLDGAVDAAVLHVSSYDVVAHLQGNDLLVGEDILYHNDRAKTMLVGSFVELLFLLSLAQLGYTHAYAELLVALWAYKDETLSCLVLGLVECDKVVTLGASYSFHALILLRGLSIRRQRPRDGAAG